MKHKKAIIISGSILALSLIGLWFVKDPIEQTFKLGAYQTSSISRQNAKLKSEDLSGNLHASLFDKDMAATGAHSNDKMTLTYNKQTVSYKQGGIKNGQKEINKKPKTVGSTWGGATVQNCADGKSTHFIGHNKGAFTMFVKAKKGQSIRVKDSKGRVANYKINEVTVVDDDAYTVNGHKDYWNKITGTGGGERIVVQTCLSKTTNLVIFASKA